MKLAILITLTAISCFFSGCGTESQAYAQKHPDLPKQHLQILQTGKIPDGVAVAGMTRDQITLVMGSNVTQYTKIDGHDAWIYVRKKMTSEPLTTTTADFNQHDSRNRNDPNWSDSHNPTNQSQIRTTIVFDGDIATRAEVVNGGL